MGFPPNPLIPFTDVSVVFFQQKILRFFSNNPLLPLYFPNLPDVCHRKCNINSEVYTINTEITDIKPAITPLNKWTMFLSSLTF